MGSSMGGYAAIAFSKYLRCDTALAYSPQNEITIQSDPRFAGHVENIEWVYPISAETIADACKFFVVYDNKDLYDKMHAERLRSIIPAERYVEILLSYAGHAVVFYLLEVGLLKQVSLNALTGNPLQRSELRKNRKQSRQYLAIVAEHLRQRRHPKLASRVRRMIRDRHTTSPLIGWAIDRRTRFLSSIAENLEVRRLSKKQFDAQFYTHLYWDVLPTGLDPLLHYVRYGRAEQRIIRFKQERRRAGRSPRRLQERFATEDLRS